MTTTVHSEQLPSYAADLPAPTRGDSGMLLAFTAGVLIISVAVAAVALASSWWVLAGVMVVHFSVTAVVTVLIAKLLKDSGDAGTTAR